MSLHTWIRKLFARKPATHHRPGYRPRLEDLENRLVPATLTVLTAGDGDSYEVIPTGPSAYSISTLRGALDFAHGLAGPDTILFAPALAGSTIALTSDDIGYPTDMGHTAFVITGAVTIQGDATRGLTLDGNGARRLFAVGPTGNLTLQYLTLTGGVAMGGDGGDFVYGGGGGGGAGLGGAIYNDRGSILLLNCAITGNTAQGGSGGNIQDLGVTGGGGGGGGSAAYDGGLPGDGGSGGGGAGLDGPGGNGADVTGGLGGLNQLNKQAPADGAGSEGGGGGGGSLSRFGAGHIAHSGGAGASPNSFGFGGGGGGGASLNETVEFGDAKGGPGGFGAGGGGAGYNGGAPGGQGGFGGGGGGGTGDGNQTPGGGQGGFGGGGGGSTSDFPVRLGGAGGGGAGLGGAIFSNGGSVFVGNSTITGNTAQGGFGGSGLFFSTDGGSGAGYGGAVFVLDGIFTNLAGTSTISGNTSSFGGPDVYVYNTTQAPVAAPPAATPAVPEPGLGLVGVRLQPGRRPWLTHLAVTFTGPVTAKSGAFRLRKRGDGLVPLRLKWLTVGGRTVARLTFATRHLLAARKGDGRWVLTVDGARVADAAGRPLGGVTQMSFQPAKPTPFSQFRFSDARFSRV